MKRIILVLTAVFMTMVAMAQQPSNITGTIDASIARKVSLFKVYNGRLVELATSTPDSLGRFAFRFTPTYEGFYSLGIGTALNQYGVYRFYFRGDEDLNLKINSNGYELVGKNSKENEALYSWDSQTNDFRLKGTTPGGTSTYVDFFPEVEAFKGTIKSIGESVKTGNPKFDNIFPTVIDYDFAYYAVNFLMIPHTAHPSKEEMSDFYTTFNADNYLTKQLLTLPYGDRFLPGLLYRKVDLASKPTFDQQVAAIPVDVLKGQFVLNRMENLRSYTDFQQMNDLYKKYFLLPEQVQRAAAVEAKLVETKTGVPAFQFSFLDIQGNKQALKDLKGKVVLLDMWATWCGPCRAEEPHWERLNEEYKDKPVAFVGVSTDKDKGAWEKYVKEKGLKGIQLHAGVANPLSDAYKVNTIPRYILIDKEGNLITADSPRPSDPKLKELLDQWTKK